MTHITNVETAVESTEVIKGRSLWQDARARFFRNKAAVVSMIILILVSLFALFGGMLTPWSNEEIDWNLMGDVRTLGGPSFETKH